jgi:hypothetical protein
MPAGLSGHLLSSSFLDHRLEHADPVDVLLRRRFLVVRRRASTLGPASSLRTLFDAAAVPLVETLGFGSPRDAVRVADMLVSTIRIGTDAQRMPAGALFVVAWGERLDVPAHMSARQATLRSAQWCLIFNGTHLRLSDASRPYSRRFVEFDLDTVADDEAAFSAFWYVMRRLPYELRQLIDDSERYGADVCRSLEAGVLAASADVLTALVRPSSNLAHSFEQALTIVYRILFLLFAEARGLVPVWHQVYRDSYSIAGLVDQTTHASVSSANGLWDALRAIARLAHAGCLAGDLRVTPFNGRLFAPSSAPLAERRGLDDLAAQRALIALTTRRAADGRARERIAYRDLGVEQLGTVYETLLDYEPRLHSAQYAHRGTRHRVVSLERGSGIRKASGTFYTPQSIADYLVRRTLEPLVRDAPPHRILSLKVVDPAMGSGAFLVTACRYLARAYESALIQSGGCHPSDIGDRERVAIRRTIAERCLYGVDVNPIAVQLARLSLWLATLAADRPLTFLDHHLQAGDSLLGTWMSMLARAPERRHKTTGRDSSTLALFEPAEVRRALAAALPLRFSLESVNETLADVKAKEQVLAMLGQRETELSRWKRVADLWCACFLGADSGSIPASAFFDLSDAVLSGAGALPRSMQQRYLEQAASAARARRLFHWELEFPEVFFGADGGRRDDAGFDAVIGNPPWDMVRADAGPTDSRAQARADLAPVLRFTRDSGVYSAQSHGHANRYQLFTERALALARRGGRIGLVLPSGLALDHGSAPLRRRLLTECDMDALVSLDNQRGIFPIHRGVQFLLVTATAGRPTGVMCCRLGERDPQTLDTAADEPSADSTWFPIRLTPELIHRVSGSGMAIPCFRTAMDLSLAERMAGLFPPIGDHAGWNARFGRELNATDDRAHFKEAGTGLPVVAGKHLEPFRVHAQLAKVSITPASARRLLHPPRYERPRLAYRDVAGASNRVTLIAAVLPADCVSTHTVFCLRTPLTLDSQHFLCGLFNSFVVNYLVRMRVTTHVTTATVERLPLPRRDDSPRAFREIAAIARRLSRRDDPDAAARLQALVARLYQLSAADFAHVLSTFPLVSDRERQRAYDTYIATEARRTQR